MLRSKLKLSFIANETSRKASFWKRKSGIMKKKLNEFTILCDVQACAVIYSLYNPVQRRGHHPEAFKSWRKMNKTRWWWVVWPIWRWKSPNKICFWKSWFKNPWISTKPIYVQLFLYKTLNLWYNRTKIVLVEIHGFLE